MSLSPNFQCLFEVATEQHGLFTSAQAKRCGYGTDLLTHQTRSGKFTRIHRGVYRLQNFPSSPREEVVAAWLAVGKDKAIVSHESALEIYGLSDVIPNSVHLTVPRSARYTSGIQGAKIHTTTRSLSPTEITTRDGIRVTSIERSIVDSADWGTGPEQIEMAVRQALERRTTTTKRLVQAAEGRSARVREQIARATAQVAT